MTDLACGLCLEPILDGEDAMPLNGYARGAHRECLVRSVIGGIEHLTAGPHRIGTCYEGSTLTYRQSAKAALRWMEEHGIPKFERHGDMTNDG